MTSEIGLGPFLMKDKMVFIPKKKKASVAFGRLEKHFRVKEVGKVLSEMEMFKHPVHYLK